MSEQVETITIKAKRGRPKKYLTSEDLQRQKEIRKEYQKTMREKEPERVKAYKRVYYEKNKSKIEEHYKLLREAYKFLKVNKNNLAEVINV